MNLTGFALNNSRLTMLITVILMVAGIALFFNFPSKEDPEVTVREAVVMAAFPGMSTARVEDLITRKLEKEIRRIPEVKKITASSKTGLAVIHVTVYDRFFELEPIWQDLRNKMNAVRPELPEGTFGPVVNSDFGDVSIATIALTSEGFSLAEMHEVAKRLRDSYYTVQGVEKVTLLGIQEERIFLETTNAKLAGYGLTPDQLIDTLRAQNIILPGGKVDTGGPEIVIEPSGNFQGVEDIANTVVSIPASSDVAYLRDVVRISRDYVDPPESLAYHNGKPAIVLSIAMQDGENVLKVGPRLIERSKELEEGLPWGYELDFATYHATYVADSINSVTNNVYQTLGIVLVMVMLFLGWRTGLIVGSIVPLTMLVSIVFMRLLDIEFERVSLATMIIALGLLVDNGVVIAEDIGRRLAEGAKRVDAAIATGKQLAMPLLSSSFTTILAFMPLMLSKNSAGEYLSSMTLVIVIALMSSWVLAMCVTPLLCCWFMGKPKKTPEQAKAVFDNRFYTFYKGLLGVVLRLRVPFVITMAAGLIGAVWLLGQVPQQFFPNSARNQFFVYLDLPAGHSIKSTDQTVRDVAGWLNDPEANPEVVSHVAYVGDGGPRFFVPLSPRDPAPHGAFMLVTVENSEAVDVVLERMRQHLAENHSEAFARLKKFFLGNSETGLMEVRISGPDAEKLYQFGEQAADALRAVPGILDVHNDWENRVTKLVVEIDQSRAQRAGVTSAEIANALNAYFSGEAITDFREDDKVIPLVLRASEDERNNLDRVRTINIYSSSRGTNVPLIQVADIVDQTQFSRIDRRNLQRTVTISAKHSWLQADQIQAAVLPAIQAIEAELPAGFSWEWGGETADAEEAQIALGEFIPHCVAAMIILLVWQFNSFAKPLIIFITIPLSFIGAAIGLNLANTYFGFMAILGFLSLAGIIINNAIVLIDQINVELEEGATPYQALINASVSRFQPVMLTTLTTILGLVPLMAPPDPLFYAMAIVIASGLSLGTILTLFAVPVLYSLFFRVDVSKHGAQKAGGEGSPDTADAVPA
ncbi:MAG: efflux RND transporter permease subunit [Geminicoccaceae bacterium]